jgi:SAM-dependent methyltransferase
MPAATTTVARRVLHVGCGPRALGRLFAGFKGWKETRLDIDPTADPDIVASIADMREVADASFDAVYSSHNLEHLEAHEVVGALREFRRVLRPGGFALIVVPDLQAAAEAIVAGKLDEPLYQSEGGPVAAIDMIFGFRPALKAGMRGMAHRTGFILKSVAQCVQEAGFPETKAIRVPRVREIWVEARTEPGKPDWIADLDRFMTSR